MNTTFKEAQNHAKQIKNAKRGGYTPTIAKDVNKQKVQKLKKYVDQIKSDHENLVDADLFDKGYKQALYNVIEDLKDILK